MWAKMSANRGARLPVTERMTASELDRIMVQFNDTEVDYPRDVCLHDVGTNRSKANFLAYVADLCSDMRPLSLRKRMEETACESLAVTGRQDPAPHHSTPAGSGRRFA